MPVSDCKTLSNIISVPSYEDPIHRWMPQDLGSLLLHTPKENLASQHPLAIFHDLCPANDISTIIGLQMGGELLQWSMKIL